MLKKIKSEKAQSLVEMALLMPILILIIGGLLDLGRAYFTFIALSDAAAEGASYASLYPQETYQIVRRATESTSGGMVVIDPDMVTVETGELVAGTPITVTVERLVSRVDQFGLKAGCPHRLGKDVTDVSLIFNDQCQGFAHQDPPRVLHWTAKTRTASI